HAHEVEPDDAARAFGFVLEADRPAAVRPLAVERRLALGRLRVDAAVRLVLDIEELGTVVEGAGGVRLRRPRDRVGDGAAVGPARVPERLDGLAARRRLAELRTVARCVDALDVRAEAAVHEHAPVQDRKSTRLNS